VRWRAALAASGAAILAAGVLAAAPAWAAPTTRVAQGEVLRLVSTADWETASRMLPGRPVHWDVTVSADAPDPGTVTIGISAAGDAPLMVDASLCTREWGPQGCSGEVTVLETQWDIPRDGSESALIEMSDTDVVHLRLALELRADAAGATDVRVSARGAGDSVVVGSQGALAATGMTSIVPPALLGAAVLLLGVVLGVVRRRSPGDADARNAS
jgi:LPXTG-motif cell wall-anchored protein